MRRKEFAARIWSKLILHERQHGLLRAGDRLLAAVSGGPDSVCLAHYLAQRRLALKLDVTLLHVHHGLRGRAADADARFVRALGEKLGLPVIVLKADVRARARRRGKGLEDAARELRYALIARQAAKSRCTAAAVGHQLDDQAETVLLQLLRGTQLCALAAMAPSRPLAPKVRLIRPLLPLRRREVDEYLRQHKLRSRLDRSNLSLKFTRNWLRRRIIPALEKRQPRIREHLRGIADQVRALELPRAR